MNAQLNKLSQRDHPYKSIQVKKQHGKLAPCPLPIDMTFSLLILFADIYDHSFLACVLVLPSKLVSLKIKH